MSELRIKWISTLNTKGRKVSVMRREFVVVILANVLAAIGSGIFGPLYALYITGMGGDAASVGIAYGIFWIIVGVMSIPFGILSDRFGKKRMIIIGGLLGAVSSLLYIFAKTPTSIYAIEVLSGLAMAMEAPALASLLSEITTEGKRGKEFGIYDSSINITYGIAMMASGLLVVFLGFASVFIASSLLQASSAVVVSKMKVK